MCRIYQYILEIYLNLSADNGLNKTRSLSWELKIIVVSLQLLSNFIILKNFGTNQMKMKIASNIIDRQCCVVSKQPMISAVYNYVITWLPV